MSVLARWRRQVEWLRCMPARDVPAEQRPDRIIYFHLPQHPPGLLCTTLDVSRSWLSVLATLVAAGRLMELAILIVSCPVAFAFSQHAFLTFPSNNGTPANLCLQRSGWLFLHPSRLDHFHPLNITILVPAGARKPSPSSTFASHCLRHLQVKITQPNKMATLQASQTPTRRANQVTLPLLSWAPTLQPKGRHRDPGSTAYSRLDPHTEAVHTRHDSRQHASITAAHDG